MDCLPLQSTDRQGIAQQCPERGTGGHARIPRCGRELGMTQQHLDYTNISSALQQVGRETVPHRARGASSTRRVQCNRFGDPDIPRGLFEQPRYLPGR